MTKLQRKRAARRLRQTERREWVKGSGVAQHTWLVRADMRGPHWTKRRAWAHDTGRRGERWQELRLAREAASRSFRAFVADWS